MSGYIHTGDYPLQIKSLRIKSYRSWPSADTLSTEAIARIKKLELYEPLTLAGCSAVLHLRQRYPLWGKRKIWKVLNPDQSTMLYLKTFAKSLRSHRVGICNYAKYSLTSARIEAGNISIGMIRKRARGLRDTEYFTLKIRQSSLPDEDSMCYVTA